MNVATKDNLSTLITPHVGEVGGVLRAMRAVQIACKHIPADAIPIAAKLFNLSAAEVRGIVSFYDDFTDAPQGNTRVRLCQAEACQAVGSRALSHHAEQTMGLSFGETSADGRISLEKVFCLGICAAAPAMLIDDVPYGRVDAERFDALIDKAIAK